MERNEKLWWNNFNVKKELTFSLYSFFFLYLFLSRPSFPLFFLLFKSLLFYKSIYLSLTLLFFLKSITIFCVRFIKSNSDKLLPRLYIVCCSCKSEKNGVSRVYIYTYTYTLSSYTSNVHLLCIFFLRDR